jgi:hypothetical protein
MKTIALTTLCLILDATAFAAPVQVSIRTSYERFDPRWADWGHSDKAQIDGDDLAKFTGKPYQRGVIERLAAPNVTTKLGQRAVIELVRKIKIPETPFGEKTIDVGITLEVLPVLKDGRIILSGRSVLRRRLGQGAVQSLGAISFATQETFFSGSARNGKEVMIAVGDGPNDKARIILTAELMDSAGNPSK